MYSYGNDYHKVIKKKLRNLERFIVDNFGDISIRGFVDFSASYGQGMGRKKWIRLDRKAQ